MGFATVSLLGTVLHFLYDLLGGAIWVAPFSGVNESTWEHMKLLFWPMLVFAAIQWPFFKNVTAFWCIKLRGTLIGLGLIPVIFYTYNGVIGRSPDWVNISIFFISAAVVFTYELRQFNSGKAVCKRPRFAVALLCFIGAAFILFTFITPHLGIFADPISGRYGIGA